MRIVTYSTADQSVPESQRCHARIRVHLPAAGKRKACEDWHPVLIHGATEADARAAAERWWDEQLAAAQAKVVLAEQRAERMRQARASKAAAV